MKSIIASATLALLGVASVAAAGTDYLSLVGQAAGQVNIGFCLAFQDDPTDTSTTCYSSCGVSATAIAGMFDMTYYTDGKFNTAELMQYGQEAMIYILTQFQDCKTTEFLFALDNRFSDMSFAVGTISNVATQVGTALGYYIASTTLTDPTMQSLFTSMWEGTAIFKLYNNFYAYFTAGQWQELGTLCTSFLLTIVNYKAPNVNTNRVASN